MLAVRVVQAAVAQQERVQAQQAAQTRAAAAVGAVTTAHLIMAQQAVLAL
jgi:hypothetical protein